MFRWIIAALSGMYLFIPNGGLVEFLPDAIPLVGHLDEVAATILMSTMLGYRPGLEKKFSGIEIAAMTVIGLLSVVYLVFPTFSLFEVIPDAIPFVGNVDEILASLITYTMANAYRSGSTGKQPLAEGFVVDQHGRAAPKDLLVAAWEAQQKEEEQHNR